MNVLGNIVVCAIVSFLFFPKFVYSDEIDPPLRPPQGAKTIQPHKLSTEEANAIRAHIPQNFKMRESLKVDLTGDGKDEIIAFYDNFDTAQSQAELASRCIILRPVKNGYKKHVVLKEEENTELYCGEPLVYKMNSTVLDSAEFYDPAGLGVRVFGEV